MADDLGWLQSQLGNLYIAELEEPIIVQVAFKSIDVCVSIFYDGNKEHVIFPEPFANGDMLFREEPIYGIGFKEFLLEWQAELSHIVYCLPYLQTQGGQLTAAVYPLVNLPGPSSTRIWDIVKQFADKYEN